MSILIREMEMPKSCYDCELIDIIENCPHYELPNEAYCQIPWLRKRRHESCPLIEVSTPHGRLIDADEFDERIRQAGGMCEEELTEDFKDGVQTVLAMLKTQTTIIPASGGKEDE